ncbi:MAG: hypothetical protein GKS07_06075 [Nitrosopumilus sp.]|nr:MAG: hypothetical protein GKS07_06075 [Nitrosopumilus sp.]
MFEQITIDVIVYLITAGVISVAGFCGALYRCTSKTAKQVADLRKAFLVIIEIMEEQTKRDHPEYDGNLLKKAQTILNS